jgi:hypothetical protein
VIYNREELMKVEKDFGSVQNFFVRAPTVQGMHIEAVIADADVIYSVFPEDKLLARAVNSAETKKLLDAGRLAIFQNMISKTVSSEDSQNKRTEKGKYHKTGSAHHKTGNGNFTLKKSKHNNPKDCRESMSSARRLVNEWRQTDLKEISGQKILICKGPKILFSLYWKWRRQMNPLLTSTAYLTNKFNPFSAGFWPALFFNHLFFATGKQLYLSVLSLAVIGGFLGYSIGEFISSS